MTTKAPGPAEVLLVEDDRALSSEMAAFLAGQGFLVHQARDAADVRRLLGSRPLAVVILDTIRDDARALCAEFTREDGPPMLTLSALGEPLCPRVMPAGGRHQHAAKPINPNDLLARITVMIRD